jgi:hypothetical protein
MFEHVLGIRCRRRLTQPGLLLPPQDRRFRHRVRAAPDFGVIEAIRLLDLRHYF